MPKVSCVLPNYNNVAFLQRSVDSLRNQTVKDIEIIIIDDASTDGSKELIEFFAKKDKRIKTVFNEERRGAAYCRNLGNSMAKAAYIAVCDSGDINHKERLQNALTTFKNKKEISMMSTVCIEVNVLDENIRINAPRIFSPDEKPSIFHPTMVYTKELTEKIKYREGNLFTDQYEMFLFDAYKEGFKFYHINKCFVRKLIQKKNDHASNERMKQRIKNFEELGVKYAGV